MIKKFYILFLALCLLAWSVITPVQAGQDKQGFKAASGKVVLQNLTSSSASSDTAVKKFSDSAFGATAHFCTSQKLISLAQPNFCSKGFVYHHPIYNILSAQAP